MSLSPQKLRIALEAEIDKRIDPESPTKYDINFYVRKINRLENDLSLLQDQLSSARVRLRKAEDFEIKYDLVLKQNNNLLAENDRLSKDVQLMRVQLERNRLRFDEETSKKHDVGREREDLNRQVEEWKKRYHESEELRLTETSQQVGRIESMSKRDLDVYRKEATDRIDKYEAEIRQLRRQIQEKQTVEKVVGMKVDRIRKEKDEEISRLNNLIERQRFDAEAMIAEKNEEVEKLQEKFQKMFDMELDNIKVNLENQDELFGIEISGLKQMLHLKNEEINKLLAALKTQADGYEREKQQLKDQLAELRDRLYKSQRENELEMYNIKERLTKIHSLDIQAVEERFKQLVATLRREKIELEKLLKAKEEQLQLDLKQLERIKAEMREKIQEREHKIRELMERLRDTGAMNSSEMKVLHESFHKIESEKEAMVTGYQENIGFLDQQLKKMTASLQLKQAEIRTIQDQLDYVKRTSQEDQRELENKWKNERREREADRERQRVELDKVEDQWRTKQKEWRTRQRALEREKEKEEREKKRLGFVVEEFEKDNARLNSYIKQLDEALKRQLKKNQLSTLDAGGIRREMVNELERQKNDLEAIKKSQVDQIVKKFEIELSRLTNENQRLQTELVTRNLQKENLDSEVKKLEGLSKTHEKVAKDKRIEFDKKMATLNSEIYLTQNLYQNFIEAKSRVKRQG